MLAVLGAARVDAAGELVEQLRVGAGDPEHPADRHERHRSGEVTLDLHAALGAMSMDGVLSPFGYARAPPLDRLGGEPVVDRLAHGLVLGPVVEDEGAVAGELLRQRPVLGFDRRMLVIDVGREGQAGGEHVVVAQEPLHVGMPGDDPGPEERVPVDWIGFAQPSEVPVRVGVDLGRHQIVGVKCVSCGRRRQLALLSPTGTRRWPRQRGHHLSGVGTVKRSCGMPAVVSAHLPRARTRPSEHNGLPPAVALGAAGGGAAAAPAGLHTAAEGEGMTTHTSIEELASRLEIRDVLTRYTVALDTRDLEMFRTVFYEESRFDYGAYGSGTGVEWFLEWVAAGMDICKATYHLLGQSLIDLDGDTATGRTYLVAQHVGKGDYDGALFMIAGWHLDRFARTPDGWRVSERRFEGSWTQGDSRVLTG